MQTRSWKCCSVPTRKGLFNNYDPDVLLVMVTSRSVALKKFVEQNLEDQHTDLTTLTPRREKSTCTHTTTLTRSSLTLTHNHLLVRTGVIAAHSLFVHELNHFKTCGQY